MTLPPTVILTATRLEQAPLRQRLGDRYASHALQWCIGGMGAGATAAATQRILQEQAPRLIIQAGIAGSLRRDLTPATAHTAYIVRSDRQADLGAWRSESGTFEPFATLPEAQTIECPYAERLSSLLPQFPARSTNSACMPLPLRDDAAFRDGEENVRLTRHDFILARGTVYLVEKGGELMPGVYTALKSSDAVDEFKIRIAGYVRNYRHGDKVVLHEGDEVEATSSDVILA